MRTFSRENPVELHNFSFEVQFADLGEAVPLGHLREVQEAVRSSI